MKSVCVYCGSKPGANPRFAAAATSVGNLLAVSGRTLVYGGGRVGLMGSVADGSLAAGGRVIGVIPRSLVEKELAHAGLTELRVVPSMHERKAIMAELSDGFLVLPGGIGTLEEFFEIWTWAQLGMHAKPIGLLDVAGFYSPMLRFIDQLVEQKFVRTEHRELLLVSPDASDLLTRMASHRSPYVPKWIDDEST